MRLRRETGDFNFAIEDGAGTIPANLSAEDLIGQIVVATADDAVSTGIVISASAPADGVITLKVSNSVADLAYTVATGAVAASV